MRVLLDTHVLLWALDETDRLDSATQALLAEADTEVLFSAASIWEIAIKSGQGRASFAVRPEDITTAAIQTGFVELPVRSSAASLVATLPFHHRDPFDRLLVAQAISEPARLLTVDAQLPVYSELVELLR